MGEMEGLSEECSEKGSEYKINSLNFDNFVQDMYIC